MALRITKAEKAELQKITRNANAKRARLINKGVDDNYLPYKFDYRQYTTRDELNAYKEAAKSFTKRGNRKYQYVIADNGVPFNKQQLDELRYAQRLANTAIEDNYTRFDDYKYNIISERLAGIDPSVNRTVGSDRVRGDNPVRYTKELDSFNSYEQYQAYIARLYEVGQPQYYEWRDEVLRTNYVAGLNNVFGSDANSISRAILSLELNDFITTYYTNDDAALEYIYGLEAYENKLETLKAIWV